MGERGIRRKRPRDAALLPSEAGTAAYAGDDDPIHIPAKQRRADVRRNVIKAELRDGIRVDKPRASALRAPGKGRDIHGG